MTDPSHLVERAAERLRRAGALDPSAASLLARDPAASPVAFDPPMPNGAAPPPTDFADRDLPPPVNDTGVSPPDAVEDLPLAVPLTDATAADPVLPMRPAATPPVSPSPTVPARVPTIDLATMEAAGMIDLRHTRSRLSEELRLVQSQVLRVAFAPEPGQHGIGLGNLVMVTSARPGEGKSFTSLNLAASIARQQDRDVLLVDVDSKAGSLGALLGLQSRPGLLDLALQPDTNPATFMVPTTLEKLRILPIGNPTERSGELFATRQMSRVIRDLGRRFADRVVILDAAPCLSSSDPSMLAPIVGQILLVVEAERTQRPEVEAALDLIQSCPSIMLLLNKVQQVQRHGFGAYASSYGYSAA